MIPFLPETVELSPKNIPRNAPRPINGTKLDGLADNPYEPNSLITLQSQINALRKVIADIDNEYLHNIARRESEATRTTDEDRAKIFSFHQKCFCSKRQNAQKALEESEGMYLLERGRISQAFYKSKDQLTGGPYWQWGNYEETQQQKFVMKGLVTVGSFGKGGVYILLANGVWAFAEGDYVEGTLSCAPAALKVLGRFAPSRFIEVERAASTRLQTLLRDSGQLSVHHATHRAVVNEAVGFGWRGDVIVLRGGPQGGTAAGITTLSGRPTLYIYEGAFTGGFQRGGVQFTGRGLVAHELGHETVSAAQAAGRTVGTVTPETVYLGSGRHLIEAEASAAAARFPGLTEAERAALLQDAANQLRDALRLRQLGQP